MEDTPHPCRNRAEIVMEMRRHRRLLKISHIEMEIRGDLQGGYATKLENPDTPYGKYAVNPSFDKWLEALDLVVVIMPRATFAELPAHQHAPSRVPPSELARVYTSKDAALSGPSPG